MEKTNDTELRCIASPPIKWTCLAPIEQSVAPKKKEVKHHHQDKKQALDSSGNNITINIELTHQFCDADNTDIDIAGLSCSNGVQQPIESTRISSSSLSNANSSPADLTCLDSSNFKSMMVNSILEDDTNCAKDVSIIAKLVKLIFSIYSDWNNLCLHGSDISKINFNGSDQILMRTVCNMKTVKNLTSTLCSVHEAIGLQDLKLLSHAFEKDVKESYIKNAVIQKRILKKNEHQHDS